MQAIRTKFIGPTNYRPDRIKAECMAGKITVSWDWALNQEQNHAAAAWALINKLDWTREGKTRIESGTLADHSYCHVLVYDAK